MRNSSRAQVQLQSFVAVAEKTDCSNLAEFLSLVGPLSDLVFASGFMEETINDELRRIAGDPYYANPNWEAGSITLASTPQWSLRFGYYARESEFIYSCPCHMIVMPVTRQSLQVHRYRTEKKIANEVFEAGVRLELVSSSGYARGEVLTVDAETDIIDLEIGRPVPVIKFTSAINQSLQWAFERGTLASYQGIAADLVSSDLVAMAKTLMAIKNPESEKSLVALATHANHYVRWSAIQAMSHVAPSKALEMVGDARRDPHPHVRLAAEKAWLRLSDGRYL